MQCSFLELYNDVLRDLLGDVNAHINLHDTKEGTVAEPVTLETLETPAELTEAIVRGSAKRVIASMPMNPRSSRGHAIITVPQRDSNSQLS